MERAKVAIIEDHEKIAEVAARALEASGHEVVAEARTRQDALKTLDLIEGGEIKVDVFLLDGKLSSESWIGEDAQIISSEIRAKNLGGHIIGFSVDELPSEICDDQAPRKDIARVIDIIDQLSVVA